MLLSSLLSSILISIWILILFDYLFKSFTTLHLKFKLIYLTVQIFSFFLLIICVKKFFFPLIFFIDNDDSHIWDLLKSKFSIFYGKEFHTFDTGLYLCTKGFDFLGLDPIFLFFKRLLLPVVIFNFISFALNLIQMKNEDTIEEDENAKAHVVYNFLQLGAFTLMTGLIKRLNIFWTPHLCIIFTLIFNQSFSWIKNFKIFSKYAIITTLIAIMSVQGIANMKIQHTHLGEYNNYPTENLVNWINSKTSENSSFAGEMQNMPAIKLSTNRAIMNHPHYENYDLRERTRIFYTYLYGYKDIELLHDFLKSKYKIDYLVVETYRCLSHPPGRPECAMSYIVHFNDSNGDKRSLDQACFLLISDSKKARKYFKKVYEIEYSIVYKIL